LQIVVQRDFGNTKFESGSVHAGLPGWWKTVLRDRSLTVVALKQREKPLTGAVP
jgi:hypothetical protein